MPRYLPNLKAVRAFESAGRMQSFSKAAQELNVTHGAISRHVRGLEQQLGVQLFKLVSQGVALTPFGQSYLREITPALDQISAASEKLMIRKKSIITVNSEPTFASKWLITNLNQFRQHHPEYEVEISATYDLADIKNNEYDLAIRHGSEPPKGLSYDLISKALLFPYANPRVHRTSNPDFVRKISLIHNDNGDLWKRWCVKAGVDQPPNLLKTARPLNMILATEAAVAGNGVILSSQELVERDVQDNRLHRISDIGVHDGGYYLVYRSENIRRKPVKKFRNWLLDQTSQFRKAAS